MLRLSLAVVCLTAAVSLATGLPGITSFAIVSLIAITIIISM